MDDEAVLDNTWKRKGARLSLVVVQRDPRQNDNDNRSLFKMKLHIRRHEVYSSENGKKQLTFTLLMRLKVCQ